MKLFVATFLILAVFVAGTNDVQAAPRKRAARKAAPSAEAAPAGDAPAAREAELAAGNPEAEAASCMVAKFTMILDDVHASIERRYSDLERDTSWIYWGRLRQTLELNPDAFNKVFETLTPEEFDTMFWAVRGGELKTRGDGRQQSMQDRLIIDLHDFLIEDTYGEMWKQPPEKRYAWAMARLAEIDKSHNSDVAHNQAEVLEGSALDVTERNVLNRMIGSYKGQKFDNSKWYDPIRRFIQPPYRRFQRILGYNNGVRRDLHHAYLVDKVLHEDVMAKAQEQGHTPEEVAALRYLLQKNAQNTAEVRAGLRQVYGEEPSYKTGVNPQQMNIYEIANRADKGLEVVASAKVERLGEKRLDDLEELMNAARARKGQGQLVPEEKSDTHLQIRYDERVRKTSETDSNHARALGEGTNVTFTVHYSWQEAVYKTEYYTDSQGKQQSRRVFSHYETRRDSVTRRPSYSNILRNSYNTSAPRGSVDSISGLESIKRETVAVRQREKPLWDEMESIQEEMKKVLDAHAENIKPDHRTAVFQQLDALRARAEKVQEDLRRYSQSSEADVSRQWGDDDAGNFKRRNLRLLARFSNMIPFLQHYRAQVARGQVDPGIVYKDAQYPEEEGFLRRKWRNTIIVKSTGAATAAAGVGAWLYQHPEKVDAFLQMLDNLTR